MHLEAAVMVCTWRVRKRHEDRFGRRAEHMFDLPACLQVKVEGSWEGGGLRGFNWWCATVWSLVRI